MQVRSFVVQRKGPDNRPINYPGAIVSVYLAGTNTLAEGVKDHLGNEMNPMPADANGVVRIAAPGPETPGAAGIYDITAVTSDGLPPIQWPQERWADVVTLAEQVAVNAQIAEDAKDSAAADAEALGVATGEAVAARDAALLSRGVFTSDADALSDGVIDIVVTAATGSDGVYDVVFAGGAGTGAKGKLVKLGATLEYVSEYTGHSYTSAPTITAPPLTDLTYAVVIGPNVPVGKHFSKPVADPGFLQLCRVDAGPVVVPVGDPYPSTAAVEEVLAIIRVVPNADGSLTFRDAAGRVPLRLEGNGTLRGVEFATPGASMDQTGAEAQEFRTPSGSRLRAGRQAHSVTDAGGRTGRMVDREGNDVMANAYIARQFRGRWQKIPFALRAEVQHIIWYGQSWPMGFDSTPLFTTQRYGNTLQFNGGIRQMQSVAENPAALQSVEPAAEMLSTGTPDYPGASLGETGALACANFINRLIAEENNLTPDEHGLQLLISAPGEGSKTLTELASNALPYMQRLKEQIARAHAIHAALGKTYCVAAVAWIQGSDFGDALNYAADLEAMRADIDAYAKSVCGPEQGDVKLVTWQCIPQENDQANSRSARRSYQRFVGAADTYPHIICAGPTYQLNYVSTTNIHIRPEGMAELGGSIGLSAKRSMIDGIKLQPLRPIELTRHGNIGLLRLNPLGGSVEIDNLRVAPITAAGLELYESPDGAPIAINSVSRISPEYIKFVAASAIPAPAVLRYAATGTNYGRTTKWRGNIRDNSYKSVGLDRWLVAFEFPFDN